MASKRKGKPVADILSKASQALAKSRELRDYGKSNPTSVYTKTLPPKTVAPPSRIISGNLNYSSSDDDIEELDILASKSPSTFIEALDKYNAGMKTTRKVKNVTVGHLGRESDLSAISSGTPSISITFKSGEDANKSKKMATSSASPIGAKPLNYDGQEIGRLGDFPTAPLPIVGDKELKIQESFEPVKLSSSDLPVQKSSNNNANETVGHPHETVAALMKRGDKVSEETYKVLQMMVKGSETADAAFTGEKKDTIISDSIDDLVLKTDASISLELEEEIEDEVPASAISENITYVGETMEDIVENLMSLDLEMEKKVELEEHPGIGVDGFDFKDKNITASRSVIIDEENSFIEEDEEESEEVTLKDVTYESDFELDQRSSMSRKSSLVKASLQAEQDYEQNFSNNEEFMISANQSYSIKERSVTFTENKPRSSVSVEKSRISKSVNISGSEKSSIISPSKKSTRSSARDASLVFYKDGSVSPSLSPEIENSSSSSKSQDKSFVVPVQPVGALLSNPVSSEAYKASSSRVKPSTSRPSEKSQTKAKVSSQPKSQRVTPRSVFQDEEVENMQKLKSSSSRQPKERSKPVSASKSRTMKSFANPVNELMNIDGEKSTRHRQKILGILRKELYEKEVRRLTREQIKAESIKKKNAKKEKNEDYLKFLQFKEPTDSEELLRDAKEWYKMRNKSNIPQPSTSIPNEPGSSSRAFEISQMMAMMEKLNNAARPSSYKKASSSTPRHNINFGAPYFTRSGDFAEGNFQPPERIQIPDLVKDVLDSHHRMYTMTIDAAKRMGKKYKQLMKEKEKNEQRNQPNHPSTSKKPAKA